MPTLSEIIDLLSAVPTTTALIALAVAAGLLVTTRDWRLVIVALTAHYVLAGIFLTRIIRSDIAMVKTLVGAMVCITLYITARRVSDAAQTLAVEGEKATIKLALLRLDSGWPFRLLVAVMGLAVAGTAATQLTLPSTPHEVILACLILLTQGLLALSLADEPLKGGAGVLTVIIGFDLFYSGVEQSLTIVGLLGLVNFSIALAMAYLTTLHAGAAEGEPQ